MMLTTPPTSAAGRASPEYGFIHTPRQCATLYSSDCGHRPQAAPTLPFLQGITRKTSWCIETTLTLIILTPGKEVLIQQCHILKRPKVQNLGFCIGEKETMFADPHDTP